MFFYQVSNLVSHVEGRT